MNDKQHLQMEVIYLAAGFGRRFGSNKLLHEFEGKALYRYGLDMILRAQEQCPYICNITVVTQYDEIERYLLSLKESLQGMLRCERNWCSEQGISSSIRIGLLAANYADAYLFCVADAPFLKERTLLELIKTFRQSPKGILCMKAGSHRSNPVIFDKKYREELLDLTGDEGGKQLFKRHPDDVGEYLINNEQELADIDFAQF